MHHRLTGRLPLLVGLAVLATGGGAFAGSSAGTVHAVANAALRTKIVADSGGHTLYHLASEKKGSVGCTGSCRKTWPPLLVTGSSKPVAGPGVRASRLGTIKRPDRGVQVTYNGYALYRYRGDTKAGQANGQGVAGVWYAITPAGGVTKVATAATTGTKSPTTTSAAPPTKTTTTTSSGGGGAVDANGCPHGQTIPQGTYAGDGDEDNEGGPDDGDGCS